MSEDRTIEPSRRRLQEARDRGRVPRSASLTAAVGLLAATAALAARGDALADALVGLIRAPLLGPAIEPTPAALAATLRAAIAGVAMPALVVLGSSLAASVAAHQAQVGGLLLPGLLLPDPARLRPNPGGATPADRLLGVLGSAGRAALLAGLATWLVRDRLIGLGIAPGDPAATIRRSAAALVGVLLRLGLALLAMGLVDYAMQHRRHAASLRMTPDEHREERRATEGDPALGSRRRAARDRRQAVAAADGARSAEPI